MLFCVAPCVVHDLFVSGTQSRNSNLIDCNCRAISQLLRRHKYTHSQCGVATLHSRNRRTLVSVGGSPRFDHVGLYGFVLRSQPISTSSRLQGLSVLQRFDKVVAILGLHINFCIHCACIHESLSSAFLLQSRSHSRATKLRKQHGAGMPRAWRGMVSGHAPLALVVSGENRISLTSRKKPKRFETFTLRSIRGVRLTFSVHRFSLFQNGIRCLRNLG